MKTSVYLLLIPIYFLLSPLCVLYKFLYSILQIAGQSRLQGNEKNVTFLNVGQVI